MSELNSTGLIFKQIPKVMAEIEAIGKNRLNQTPGASFKFRGIDDVYNELHSRLAKHGVFTVPIILGRERKDIVSKAGNKGYHAVTNFRFRFYAEDGSFVEADADGEAADYGDKVSNKAASIAHKYALLQVFCIPTEDDKDPDSVTHNIVERGPSTANSNNPKVSAASNSKPIVTPQLPQKNAFTGISDNQRGLAYTIAKKLGWGDDEVNAKWREWTKKDSSKNWTREDFDLVLKKLSDIQKSNPQNEQEMFEDFQG
jgi:hypothetical protein